MVEMLRRKSFPKVLLFLAAFVFFSANTIYMLEADTSFILSTCSQKYKSKNKSKKNKRDNKQGYSNGSPKQAEELPITQFIRKSKRNKFRCTAKW